MAVSRPVQSNSCRALDAALALAREVEVLLSPDNHPVGFVKGIVPGTSGTEVFEMY